MAETRWCARLLVIISVFTVAAVIVTLTTSVLLNRQKNNNDTNEIQTKTSVSVNTLVDTINSTQLMFHLEQIQTIADNNNGTRYIGTPGFPATVKYIEKQLKSKTNFHVFRQQFIVQLYIICNPVLISIIGGNNKTYVYETDFLEALQSPPTNFSSPIRLTIIPNSGCHDDDWRQATPYPATGSVTLVIHDKNCTAYQKSKIAQKYSISGLLLHDTTINATSLPHVIVSENITYPAMILSYELGAQLIEATRKHLLTNASVQMFITPENRIIVPTPSVNLCADTPTGNITQTIVVGAHSDSVPNGPGINDNGSGAMGVLVLALNLAHLFQTSSYEKYPSRIRFCWWGAEENGLLGSYYHVEQANITTVIGNRLKDYMLVLNFDMLASPNYYFGIYEGYSLPDEISPTVKNASEKISKVFRNWFDKKKLPWDNSSAGILSDHVPFVVAGVPCGGIGSGEDEIKTLEQRNRYDRMLGHGHGGIADIHFDPCYHQACDSIANTNPFAYEILTKSAANTIETLGHIPDLHSWLYD